MKWLTKFDKSLYVPTIVFTELTDAAGLYHQPYHKHVIKIDGKSYDASKGLILIDTKYEDTIAGTIAHEWRHHWQRCNIGKLPVWPWSPTEDYKQSIINYFQAWHEFDALRFQYKYAKDWSSEIRMNWIKEYWDNLCQYPRQ